MQHILFPSMFLMASQSVVTLNLKQMDEDCWEYNINIIFITEVLGHKVFYFSARALVRQY